MKTYHCTAQHPFDSFRMWFMGIIALFIFFVAYEIETYINVFLAAILVSTLFNALLALFRIVSLSKKRKTIRISNLLRTKEIEGPYSVETWWMYEINESYDDSWQEFESKPVSNYLKLYAKIKGENGNILLCETIKLQGKFPNDHPYRYDLGSEDLKDAFDIWDVDNCLKKLRLSKMYSTSNLVLSKNGSL